MMTNQTSLSPLESAIRVRESGVRAVNVVYDLAQPGVADGYVITAQVLQSLGRVAAGLAPNVAHRAWTLTGPYGSGKSYFGLFTMNLLGKSLPGYAAATLQLYTADPTLLTEIQEFPAPAAARGLLPIPITGYRGALHECLRDGIRRGLEALGEHPAVRGLLEDEFFVRATVDSRAVMAWLPRLQRALADPELGYGGCVVVLDEMGKLLEYAATHPAEVDLYLLQELAEFANRSGATPIVFIGILHQSFDRYAGHLDINSQREWSKIQGRFEDISFQEPTHQQMWLIQRALAVEDAELARAVAPMMSRAAEDALAAGWRPPLMGAQDFLTLTSRAYPFHPTVLVALPSLFRRLAQNERSIFAYLAAHEPFGFQEFLATRQAPAMVRLADLFDYLTVNFQGRFYTMLRARAITETLARLENTPKLDPLAVDVLKTVGLLNWLAENSPLVATLPTLLAALRDEERPDGVIRQALERLQSQSLLVYRRFNQSYGIWQGSDVDLEEQLQLAHQKLSGAFSLAEMIQEFLPPRPLVARRHSCLTGATHYFEVRYVDAGGREHAQVTTSPAAAGVMLLCLATHEREAQGFAEWAQGELAERGDVVVGVNSRTGGLAELCRELRALQWVKENTPGLRDDQVARREVRARFHQLETLIRNELDRTLAPIQQGDAQAAQWWYRGLEFTQKAGQGLSFLLSEVCGQLYPDQPKVRNEIINRRALSSQGAAARRSLIEAMLNRADQPRLGIEGFPPERSMYESLLLAGGLHREGATGGWGFTAPGEEDPLRLQPSWAAIRGFLFDQTPVPRGVDQLYGILNAPPYGVSEGVLPLLLCAFWLVHADEMTLYSEGTLLPAPTIADWEVLLRRPELFAVAGCRVIGPRAAVVERLARGLKVQPATMPVVRELVRRLKTLPEHAWRTQRLAKTTLAFRRAIEQAHAPEQLLFVDIPQALDLPPFAADAGPDAVAQQMESFFGRLNGALQELAGALPQAVQTARNQFLSAWGLAASDQGWREFLQQAGEIARTIQHDQLSPLLQRADGAPDPQAALESVLAYISGRPPRLWTDLDRDRFVAHAERMATLYHGHRNGHAARPRLNPDQERRSRQVAADLRRLLDTQWDADPVVAQAALTQLLDELRREQAEAVQTQPIGVETA